MQKIVHNYNNTLMKERQENMFIDLGGNLLPAFADGTRDVKACAERISSLYKAGVNAAVLTPRYYPAKRSVEEFLEFREKVLHTLSYNMPDKCPTLYLGCEVYVDERLKYISTIDALTVLGTRTMITYMPEGGEWEGSLIDTIEAIRAVGIEVLIAHIDRYPVGYAEDLFKYGYRGILDVSALVGISNLHRRKKLLTWIDKGYIVGIGSNYEVKNKQICKIIKKAADYVGIQINFRSDEKKLARIIAKATAAIGKERLKKLTRATEKVLRGALQITE